MQHLQKTQGGRVGTRKPRIPARPERVSILNEEEQCRSLLYAETFVGIIRRIGFVPGIGNCMCQKFVSGETNSTPTYCLPSRALWMDTMWHSIDCAVWSFFRITVCPTNTISSSWNNAPFRFTDCVCVCALNLSPISVFPWTVKGTVSATRRVRRRSLQRK